MSERKIADTIRCNECDGTLRVYESGRILCDKCGLEHITHDVRPNGPRCERVEHDRKHGW